MSTINKEFLNFAEDELTNNVINLGNFEKAKAKQIAKEILKIIDWDNSALMHKGFTWMVKNYLIKQKLIQSHM